MTATKQRYMVFYGTAALLFLFLMESERMAEAARAALLLCAHSLIPSLLPSIVLAGLLSAASGAVHLPGEGLFRRLFHLPSIGATSFLLGALCGFPIGAKVTAELWEQTGYKREDAACIAALSSNTGPAFVVAGVGAAFFGSKRIGWALYLIQMVSAIILGIIAAKGRPLPPSAPSVVSKTSRFSFPDILYRSSLSLLSVTGTVVFFGALCALPDAIFPKPITAILAAVLEIGNGAHYASTLPLGYGFPLAAFSISFSGISVLCQNASHLTPAGIPLAPLLLRKLAQGVLSALLSVLVLPYIL